MVFSGDVTPYTALTRLEAREEHLVPALRYDSATLSFLMAGADDVPGIPALFFFL